MKQTLPSEFQKIWGYLEAAKIQIWGGRALLGDPPVPYVWKNPNQLICAWINPLWLNLSPTLALRKMKIS